FNSSLDDAPIVGMYDGLDHRIEPGRAGRSQLLDGYAGVLDHLFIKVGRIPIGRQTPDQHGNGIDDLLQCALALTQSSFSRLQRVNIDSRAIPSDDAVIAIVCGQTETAEPAIRAVCTPHAMFAAVISTRLQAVAPRRK